MTHALARPEADPESYRSVAPGWSLDGLFGLQDVLVR
jgi:hypothetical protein